MKTTAENKVPTLAVGQTYPTREGGSVKIVSEHPTPGHETVKGDDNFHRYQRAADRGRVTGTSEPHPLDIVLPSAPEKTAAS